jgi:hypothetical protein
VCHGSTRERCMCVCVYVCMYACMHTTVQPYNRATASTVFFRLFSRQTIRRSQRSEIATSRIQSLRIATSRIHTLRIATSQSLRFTQRSEIATSRTHIKNRDFSHSIMKISEILMIECEKSRFLMYECEKL